MPTLYDSENEISHLRKLYREQREQIAALADQRDSARAEMEAARLEARRLREEVARLQSDLQAERKRRWDAEAALKTAQQSLAVHRRVQDVGAEMLAAVQVNHQNGGKH